MFGILFRATLLDLLKVLLVTTAVLVTVIAFGAAIKPLAQNLLGPADLLKYMAYATVPMLQFALPFAAAFAGVIVYHRMSIDNEVLAMAVSGLPYRRILMPTIALGVALTVVMLVLVDVGVPMFWQALKRLVATDVTRVFVAQVERGEAFRVGHTEIYADEAHLVPAPPDSGATQRLVLVGVAAIETGDDGLPRREFTAQFATVDVHRVKSNSVLKVALQDATVFNRGDRAIAGSRIVRPEAVDLGQAIEQGPKGLRLGELLALRNAMEDFPPIAERRRRLLNSLAACEAWSTIAAELAAGRALTFQSGDGEGAATWVVEAHRLDGTNLVGVDASGVIIRHYVGGAADSAHLRSEITAPRVDVSIAAAEDGATPRFDLRLDEALVRDPRTSPGGKGIARPVRLAELAFAGHFTSRADLPNGPLIEEAARLVAATAGTATEEARALVEAHANDLASWIAYYQDEIVARIVQRSSQSMTAFLMLTAASIFAIGLRHRAALVVYLLAFVPAILDILLISGGEQMLRRDVSAAGFAVAFSGNAALLLVCIAGWWKLSRH